MMNLTVKYSCTQCGIVDALVHVPPRVDDDDLMVWMKDLSVYLLEDHAFRSPSCHPTSLQNVLIPLADGPDARVGGPIS